MESHIELLQGMPIFGGIRDATLRLLLARCSMVDRAPGDFFFHEDDEAQAVYVLESGRAAVVKKWEGQQYVLTQLGAGDCFGEMSLMDLRHRSASVVAVETCRAIELSGDSLHALYQHDLAQFALIQMNMGREVSRRLRDADERLFQARMGLTGGITEYVFRST